MGRPQASQPPVQIEYVRDALAVRPDGCLVWRERPASHFPERVDDRSRFNNQRAGGPAGFAGPDGRQMVRLQFEGRTRRIAALRVAWALAIGEWPRGVVRARDGNDNNCRFDNLILTKAGPRPFDWGKGGKASSLERRAKTTTTLIRTLADHPGSTVPQLSRLVGSSAPCVCTRLGKLSDMGLTCGPKCDARARWDLTPAGRELAAAANPVVIDDLDRRILGALALIGMGTLKLARRVGACPMTIKRRARLLAARGLVFADPRKFFSITDGRVQEPSRPDGRTSEHGDGLNGCRRRLCSLAEGRAALGPNNPPRPAPWLRPEQVSAAVAKDVRQRHGQEPDDRSPSANSTAWRASGRIFPLPSLKASTCPAVPRPWFCARSRLCAGLRHPSDASSGCALS